MLAVVEPEGAGDAELIDGHAEFEDDVVPWRRPGDPSRLDDILAVDYGHDEVRSLNRRRQRLQGSLRWPENVRGPRDHDDVG